MLPGKPLSNNNMGGLTMLKLKVFFHSETKKQYRSLLKKISLFCIIFLFMAGLASATNYAAGLGWWSNYYTSETSDGNVGQYNLQAAFTSEMAGDSHDYGHSFSPMIADLDSDNVTEIFISEVTSNYLIAYRYLAGSLTIETQQDQGDDQILDAAVFFDHNTNKWSLAVPISTGIKVFTYNGSFFNNTLNITSPTPATAILCSSHFDTATYGNICWWMTTTGKFFEFHSKDYSVTNTSIDSACTSYLVNIASPDIAFSNNLNGNKVIVTCFSEHAMHYISPITLQNKTISVGATSHPGRVMAYNADGSGHDEVFVLIAGSVNYLDRYDSGGTLNEEVTLYAVGTGCPSTLAYADMAAGSFYYSILNGKIRQVFVSMFNNYLNTKCFWAFAAENFNDWSQFPYGHKAETTGSKNLIAVDMDGDGYDDVITPMQVIFPNDASNSFNWSTNSLGHVAAADINDDGFAEVVGTTSSLTWFASGTPSSFSIALNGRQLDRNYGNPVCTNSSVCFDAKDAVAFPYYQANYLTSNNNTQEYLFTGCGKTPLWIGSSGDASANNPSVCCYYGINETLANPIRTFKVYITDTITGTLMTGLDSSAAPYWDVQVNLLNQKPSDGYCNQVPFVAPWPPITPLTAEAAAGTTEAQVKSLFDSLTYGSAFVKTVLVFLLFLGVIVFLAMYAHVQNPIIYIIVSIVMLCLCAVVGLISWAYIILIGFLIALVAGIAWFSGGLGSSNGGP